MIMIGGVSIREWSRYVSAVLALSALATGCGGDDKKKSSADDSSSSSSTSSSSSSNNSNSSGNSQSSSNSGSTNSSSSGAGGASGGSGGGPACPASCNDGNACTQDIAEGDPEDCSLTCSYEAIDSCEDDDGCCPAGCDQDSDNDCTTTTVAAIPDDRRIPWNPGVPGGIPNRTELCETIDADQYGDGNTDATSAIQDALDSCPEDQVVYLPAGEYRLSDGLQVPSGVTLRGNGPESTRLILESGYTAVSIGYGAPNNIPGVAVTAGFEKGSTELTLSNASDFSPGDIVLIDQLDDQDLVSTGDCEFLKRWDGSTFRSLGQIFEIVAKDGNTIEISSPLYFTYSEGLSPEVSPTYPDGQTVKYAGVEDLYVTRTSAGGSAMFHLIDAAYSWVKNVHSEKVDGRHALLETCYRCEVRDSYFHDAFELVPGGTAYGIALERHSSDNLVENNIVTLLNIPIVFSVSSGGNVIAYNFVDDAVQVDVPEWNTAGIRGHCSFPYMELVEGNYANQGGMDNVHGGSGYLTFYRNRFTAQRSSFNSSGNNFAIAFDENQLYMNVLGNVLWAEGVQGQYEVECGDDAVYQFGRECSPSDPRVAQTVLRHGNFDFVNNDVLWDDDISDRNLPPSLYLSAKPEFFGDLPWPPFDPTSDDLEGELPAKTRYESEFAQ